ncbi:MAG: aldo/keto reductase [Candidatus Hodarchaeota archaeon]
MKYRKMGSLDWKVSALGFGAMRLPTTEKNKIDEEESIKMIRYAIDNGVNYIDTAYPYHDGMSEVVVGKALKNGYRQKVYLTTKLPMWLVIEKKDFDLLLNQQIERLQTTPDIYLFHGLNKLRFEKVKKFDLITKMEEAKVNGIFKHFGFSFHDSFDVFKEIIDYYQWECCQIQHNYLDINYQAGTKGLQYAGSKSIAVIIMEPIRGGKLAIPEKALNKKPEIKRVIENSKFKRTMADWALQFLWNQPEVSVVLSGMSNMQQVIENVESAKNSGINILKDGELETIFELYKTFNKYTAVNCTNCGYCMPCPNGVAIPFNFRLLNEIVYWGERRRVQITSFYNRMAKTPEELNKRQAQGYEADGAASLCIHCDECLDKCPQQFDIPDFMEKVKSIFENGQDISEVLG